MDVCSNIAQVRYYDSCRDHALLIYDNFMGEVFCLWVHEDLSVINIPLARVLPKDP